MSDVTREDARPTAPLGAGEAEGAEGAAGASGAGASAKGAARASTTSTRAAAPAKDRSRHASSADDQAYRSVRLLALRAWAFVGCAAVFVIAVRALGAVGMALECVLVGIIVGFVCSGITNWLERHGVNRAVGALAALFVVIAAIGGIILWVGPMLVEQLRQLLGRIPAFFVLIQSAVGDLWSAYGNAQTVEIQSAVQEVLQALSEMGTTLAGELANELSSGLVPNVMNLANSFVMFFLGLVMAYWFAKDYPLIMRELTVIAGPRHADDLALLVAVLSRSTGGYMRGIVITSLLNGLLAFVGFALVGNPYAGLMGTLVGVLHFVPVIGPAVSAALATLVGLFASPAVALWTLVWAVIAQNVTDNLVSPLVMQSAVKIHPAMSLIGITVGASLGGALGMAVAVPLTAAIKGLFVYFFESTTARQLVSYDGAFFKGTPFHHEDGSPVPAFDALDDDSFLASTRLVEYDEVAGVEAEEPPSDARPAVTEALRHQLEDFKRLRK